MLGPPLAAFVADVHVGNPKWLGGALDAGVNARGRLVLDALARGIAAAKHLGARCFVVLGDLLDSSRAAPPLIAAVMGLFANAAPLQVVLLMGNHDLESDSQGDHALAPFAFLPNVRVVEEQTVIRFEGDELWLIPFRSGPAKEWLPRQLAELSDHAMKTRPHTMRGGPPPRVCLGLHLGIIDASTPPYLRDADDAVTLPLVEELALAYGVESVVAGNWHARKCWELSPYKLATEGPREVKLHVMQVGALAPTGFNNKGWDTYGTVAHWDGDRLGYLVVEGPRFFEVRTLAQWEEVIDLTRSTVRSEGDLALYQPTFVRWVVDDPEDMGDAEGRLRALIGLKVIAGGEVIPGIDKPARDVSTAATLTSSPLSVSTKVSAFVLGMELPPDLSAEVLNTVQGYLQGAGVHHAGR